MKPILKTLMNRPFFQQFFPLVMQKMLNCWFSSCTYEIEGMERSEPLFLQKSSVIVTTWHCAILGLFSLFSKPFPTRNGHLYLPPLCVALLSGSRDASLFNQILCRLGIETVRGSSGRGGSQGALDMIRALNKRSNQFRIGIVIGDGSRGPARKLHKGIPFIAKHTNSVVCPLGIASRPCKILNSWDRHIVPLPFSKIAVVIGQPIIVDDPATTHRQVQEGLREAFDRADLLVQRTPE